MERFIADHTYPGPGVSYVLAVRACEGGRVYMYVARVPSGEFVPALYMSGI